LAFFASLALALAFASALALALAWTSASSLVFLASAFLAFVSA